MSKIKKKRKKKNYTLKKKRYSKRGGSSAVQPNQVVEAKIVQPNQVVEAEMVQPNQVVEAEMVQPNQVVEAEIVSQNEKAMESRQPNNSPEKKNGMSDGSSSRQEPVALEQEPESVVLQPESGAGEPILKEQDELKSTRPNNSPEKKNGMSDDDSDEAVLVFRVNVNETCPTNYKSFNKKQTKFCYKLTSRSDLIQNYDNKTPLEIDVTPKEQNILDDDIKKLKLEQQVILTLEEDETRLNNIMSAGQELTPEDKLKLDTGKKEKENLKQKMKAKMKDIVKKHGFAAVRYMIVGGLTMAVTLLLFPAIGVAAPGAGSAVFKGLDRLAQTTGNLVSQKINQRTTNLQSGNETLVVNETPKIKQVVQPEKMSGPGKPQV